MNAGWATVLLLGAGAVSVAACGSHRNLRTIDSLAESSLDVSSYHGTDQSTVGLTLAFQQVGLKLGDDCPVVVATATLNGAPLTQMASGGAMACDDPPYCESEGGCLVASWFGAFPSGFPPTADGMVTVTLADAGTPVTVVSGVDLWATATVSDVTVPTDPGGAPQATLTLAPLPPYPEVDVVPTTNPHEPSLDLLFKEPIYGEHTVTAADTGVPNQFQLSFPSIQDLPRPSAGEIDLFLYFAAPSRPPITVCTGVQTCTATPIDQMAPLPLTLPL